MRGMAWWMLALVFDLLWVGVALLIDGLTSGARRRMSLAERLAPYQPPPSVAEEAERWLGQQR
jgi:hypothetical protein